MKKLLLTTWSAAAIAMGAMAAEVDFSYGTNGDLMLWGAKTAQTYDMAISLTNVSFVGSSITKISMPVMMTENISDYKVWLTSELALGTVDGVKVNVPDIMSVDVTPEVVDSALSLGVVNYTLAEPYTIPQGGVYVGFSLKVAKVSSDVDRYPIPVEMGAADGAMYVHTSKTYRNWQDRSEQIGAHLPLTVTLAGDFTEYSVGLDGAPEKYVKTGKATELEVTVYNHGSQPVTSLAYELTVNGATTAGECTLATPLPNTFNASTIILVDFPALPAAGIYDYTLAITKVNGQPNTDANAKATSMVEAMDILPIKRPLMEEFTGTWCGWCPRGWVAMEKMSEFHPDFICVSYHDSDIMQLPNGYPQLPDGFPSAFLDRTISCDPYYGTNSKPFGIEALWIELCKQFADAEIELEAKYNAELGEVSVTSNVAWAVNPGDGDYRVEYVLLGDGICNDAISQANYFTRYSQAQADLYLEDFCAGGKWGKSEVPGLVFNDVALLNTGGRGVAGSITSTESGSSSEYTYTFKLADNPVITLAKKLKVVAMVLKAGSGYGTVINANKANVDSFSGIADIKVNSAETEIKYFDLSGRELVNPQPGIVIRSARHADGSVTNSKVIIR